MDRNDPSPYLTLLKILKIFEEQFNFILKNFSYIKTPFIKETIL